MDVHEETKKNLFIQIVIKYFCISLQFYKLLISFFILFLMLYYLKLAVNTLVFFSHLKTYSNEIVALNKHWNKTILNLFIKKYLKTNINYIILIFNFNYNID
jgi:hypothetical protein